MNRRGFFRLMAGASALALAPALLARPDYSQGHTFRLKPAAHNTGPAMLQINGGPSTLVIDVSEDGINWRTPPQHGSPWKVSLDNSDDARRYVRLRFA